MSYENQQLQPRKGVIRISPFVLLAVLYIAHKVLPAVGYYMPSIVYLGVFGLTFFLALPVFRYKAAWTIAGMFAVSLLSLISRLLDSTSSGALYLYGELQVYLYGIIALRVIAGGDTKTCRRMFVIIMVMYLITAVTTYIGGVNYPGASRTMATLSSSDLLYRTYVKENIGSFVFVYELVLLTPLLIYLTRQKYIKPVLGYLLIAFIGVVIVATEYGMAVMLYFASLVLLVFPKLTSKKLMILLLVLVLVFVVGAELVANVFEQLSLSVESETLAERFLAVAETLRGEDELSATTGQTRMEFYKKAINVFWNTTFLGGWGTISTGGHSFVLDALGNYGVLGIAALVVVFVTMYNLCLKPYRGYNFHPYLLWIYCIAVFLMVMNPKVYSFTFLCVVPLFGNMLKDDERSKEHEIPLDRK